MDSSPEPPAAKLNFHEMESKLESITFFSGQNLPGKLDYYCRSAITKVPDRLKFPYLFDWYWSMYPFGEFSRKLWMDNPQDLDEGQNLHGYNVIHETAQILPTKEEIEEMQKQLAQITLITSIMPKENAINLGENLTSSEYFQNVVWHPKITICEYSQKNLIFQMFAMVAIEESSLDDLRNILEEYCGNKFKVLVDEHIFN